MARLIARKIRRDPKLFQEAVETLRHWKKISKPVPEAILEWDRIFKRNSLEKILETFTEDSEEGKRRRQSDPFCGILTYEESMRFLDEYEKKGV